MQIVLVNSAFDLRGLASLLIRPQAVSFDEPGRFHQHFFRQRRAKATLPDTRSVMPGLGAGQSTSFFRRFGNSKGGRPGQAAAMTTRISIRPPEQAQDPVLRDFRMKGKSPISALPQRSEGARSWRGPALRVMKAAEPREKRSRAWWLRTSCPEGIWQTDRSVVRGPLDKPTPLPYGAMDRRGRVGVDQDFRCRCRPVQGGKPKVPERLRDLSRRCPGRTLGRNICCHRHLRLLRCPRRSTLPARADIDLAFIGILAHAPRSARRGVSMARCVNVEQHPPCLRRRQRATSPIVEFHGTNKRQFLPARAAAAPAIRPNRSRGEAGAAGIVEIEDAADQFARGVEPADRLVVGVEHLRSRC